ncbi:MAG: four helix bundle protein [Cytophagales bacterium]|nr:four helix bundle protein [Cytophagales bacterium]
MGFKFEELKVWQKAIDLTADVNTAIKKFPVDERYVLSPQMQRVTDSIALNIAEGSTGQSNKEFARFLGIALRSGIVVVSYLHIAQRRTIIDQQDFNRFYNAWTEISKMIQSLRRTLRP